VGEEGEEYKMRNNNIIKPIAIGIVALLPMINGCRKSDISKIYMVNQVSERKPSLTSPPKNSKT
jgi:hypothetical protein